MSFIVCVVSGNTGTLQVLCWVTATTCVSCYQGRRWSTSRLNWVSTTPLYSISAASRSGSCTSASTCSDMEMTDGEHRDLWRKQPISWANLGSIREVGKPQRANTSLQREQALNILPARAAEIQLQPNEEWADLPSRLLLPLCLLPSLLSPCWSSSWTVTGQVSRCDWFHRGRCHLCPSVLLPLGFMTLVSAVLQLVQSIFFKVHLYYVLYSLSKAGQYTVTIRENEHQNKNSTPVLIRNI